VCVLKFFCTPPAVKEVEALRDQLTQKDAEVKAYTARSGGVASGEAAKLAAELTKKDQEVQLLQKQLAEQVRLTAASSILIRDGSR